MTSRTSSTSRSRWRRAAGWARSLAGRATVLAVVPVVAGAAGVSSASAAGEAGAVVLAANSIDGTIGALQAWLLGILAALATLFLVIGGVRYLMAGGDPAEVEKAKTALRSAGIGYGLAVLAPSILAVLKSIVGGP